MNTNTVSSVYGNEGTQGIRKCWPLKVKTIAKSKGQWGMKVDLR